MKQLTFFALAIALGFGAMTASAESLDEAISSIAQTMITALQERQVKSVAVYNFSELNGYQSALADYLSEEVLTALVGRGEFRVVERRELDRILQEQGLYGKDLFDPSSLAELQKLKGIDALITGTLTRLSSKVRVNARMLNVETGAIMAAKSVSADRGQDVDTLLGSSSNAAGANQSHMIDGLIMQPADVNFKSDAFTIKITGVRLLEGGTVVVVASNLDNVTNSPINVRIDNRGEGNAETEVGERFRVTLFGIAAGRNLETTAMPNAPIPVSWKLESRTPIQGAKVSIRTDFYVSSEGKQSEKKVPVSFFDLRLR